MGAWYKLDSCRILILIVIFATGCKSAGSQNEIGFHKDSALSLQELRLPSDTLHAVYDRLLRKKPVVTFYQYTDGRPVWLDDNGLTARGDSLTSILQQATYYGLPPERYHLKELRSLNGRYSEIDLLRREVLLTDAFLAFARDIRFGVVKTSVVTDDSSQVALLKGVIRDGGLKQKLDSQGPDLPGYRSLIHALQVVLDQPEAKNVEDSAGMQHEVRKIAVNLERWRREEKVAGQRYIMINIPAYMLYVIEDNDTVLSSRVIVGSVRNQTPQLSSVITNFTIYPYWHVPGKIAINEYLPLIQKDTSFIRRNNFDVLDRQGNVVNPDTLLWNSFHKKYFPVSLRQREGVENSLGVIKFYFDNPFAVFLHDTNAKKLFKREARAFSHGCIRVEEAGMLAHYLVTGDPSIKSKMVERYLTEKKRSVIGVSRPIPIHIRYFTVEVVDGKAVFHKDIYGADSVLEELFRVESGVL